MGRKEVPIVPKRIALRKAPNMSTSSVAMVTISLPVSTAERLGWTTRTVFHMFWPRSSPMNSAASSATPMMYGVGEAYAGPVRAMVARPCGENSACIRSVKGTPSSTNVPLVFT